MRKNVMLNMTVNGSPVCEPHDSVASAIWSAMEQCKTKCLEHVTIKKAASKRELSSSLELPSGSGFHKEFVKGGEA